MSKANLTVMERRKDVAGSPSGAVGGGPGLEKSWHERIRRSGFLVGAILFHLILFLMIATIVVWKAPTPSVDATFQPAQMVKLPSQPPPPQPPSSGDATENPELEPTPVVVPVVTPPSVITSANSSFNVDAAKAINQALNNLSLTNAQGSGLTGGSGNSGSGNGAGFGNFTGGTNDFEGTIYDLKIDPQHHPTGMNQATYTKFLSDFITAGWRESDFDRYYKASKKLYTSSIWIPTTKSEACATEMGLNHELTSTFWVGWYQAKVIAPQGGRYHFVGFGDDILAVAVNGQLVLDGSLYPVTPKLFAIPWTYDAWSVTTGFPQQKYGRLRVGDSFSANTVESLKSDVLLGDEPGGYYNAYLMLVDESKTYPQGPGDMPLFPIFQLGSSMPVGKGDQPPHATTPEPWSGAP